MSRRASGPVVVLGDSLLDIDVDGTADRLCPDAPVPVVDLTGRTCRPGGAGLAALLAARAGHEVVLVTALGADRDGAVLADLLAEHVTVLPLPLTGGTVSKTRVRAGGQPLLRLDRGGGAAARPGTEFAARLRAALAGAAAVLVADYGRGVTSQPAVRAALTELSGDVPLVWDPHPRGAPPVPGCLLVTPNRREAAQWDSPAQHGGAQAAGALRERWHCQAVAMTLGAEGALLVTADGPDHIPVPGGPVHRPADTCGAGDAFAAAACVALVDHPLPAAVTEAVAAAARFVAAGGAGALGTLPPEPATAEPEPGGPGVPEHTEHAATRAALRLAERVRRRGGRLVATGGCFDLLHPGHLRLLREARALGDALVVCLNSDASVRRLKGPTRPILPATGRAALLQALDPVDAVAVFDEDTPCDLLERLRPDVWVKGGDYHPADLPETRLLARRGGKVVIVPRDGYSTSGLVSGALTAIDSAPNRQKETP